MTASQSAAQDRMAPAETRSHAPSVAGGADAADLIPVVVGQPIAGDRTEPCDRIGPAIEVLPVADHLQERLLGDLFGESMSPPQRAE